MHHKYVTESIVLTRHPLTEASSLITLLTAEFGVVRARAQGVRKPGAKLAAALQTLSQSDVTLIHGRGGWRISGAMLEQNWTKELSKDRRERAFRIAALIARLAQGDERGSGLYPIMRAFLAALTRGDGEEADAAECQAALMVLGSLGFEQSTYTAEAFSEEALRSLSTERVAVVARINRAIAASGL